jgi:hypothetical protein
MSDLRTVNCAVLSLHDRRTMRRRKMLQSMEQDYVPVGALLEKSCWIDPQFVSQCLKFDRDADLMTGLI